MPKRSPRKRRKCHETATSSYLASDIFRARELTSVEFFVGYLAIEDVSRVMEIRKGKIHTFGLDFTDCQWYRAIVHSRCEGHLHWRHCDDPRLIQWF